MIHALSLFVNHASGGTKLMRNVTSYTSEAQRCFSQIKRQCPRVKPWTYALRAWRLPRSPRCWLGTCAIFARCRACASRTGRS